MKEDLIAHLGVLQNLVPTYYLDVQIDVPAPLKPSQPIRHDLEVLLLLKPCLHFPGQVADDIAVERRIIRDEHLKDEYSESDLEDALIAELERFLLELGNDFTFVARQRRLRIGTEWYRVDLLLFNRRLRCLVVIDLKIGKFTHADAGQMNLYLNYAREHWALTDENPPVGLILCSEQDSVVAHYALEGLRNTVLAREYQLALPDEGSLAKRIEETRHRLLES